MKDRIIEMHINFNVTSHYVKSKLNTIDYSLRLMGHHGKLSEFSEEVEGFKE